MEFTYRVAKESDAEEIYKIMKIVEENMINTDDFVSDDLDFIKVHIKDRGFIVLAIEKEKQERAGFFIIRFPGDDIDNLGNDLKFDKEKRDRVVHMESAAVLPVFRGWHLQEKMLKFALEKLDDTSICMATVAPQNKASLSAFIKNDFEVVLTKKKYGGKMRHILLRRKNQGGFLINIL